AAPQVTAGHVFLRLMPAAVREFMETDKCVSQAFQQCLSPTVAPAAVLVAVATLVDLAASVAAAEVITPVLATAAAAAAAIQAAVAVMHQTVANLTQPVAVAVLGIPGRIRLTVSQQVAV